MSWVDIRSHAWAWGDNLCERLASRPVGIIFVFGFDDAEAIPDIPLRSGNNSEDFLAWAHEKIWYVVY